MIKKELEIVVFACEWTPMIAADDAGIKKYRYSPSVTIIKVVCIGQINPSNILSAFKNGADGVMIAGCDKGDCHYTVGNEKCSKVVDETKELLQYSGVNPKRLHLKLFSQVDGKYFVSAINKFEKNIKKIGKIHAEVSS